MNTIIHRIQQFVNCAEDFFTSRLRPLCSKFVSHFRSSKPFRNCVLLTGILSPVLIFSNCKGGGDGESGSASTRSSQELIDTISDCTLDYSSRSQAQIETQDLRDQCVKELIGKGPGALEAIHARVAKIRNLISEGRLRGARYGASMGNIRAGANMMAEVDARYLPPLESLKAAAKAIEAR